MYKLQWGNAVDMKMGKTKVVPILKKLTIP